MFDTNPDSKVHGANMGPTWVLSAPDGPHVGLMNLAIREGLDGSECSQIIYISALRRCIYPLLLSKMSLKWGEECVANSLKLSDAYMRKWTNANLLLIWPSAANLSKKNTKPFCQCRVQSDGHFVYTPMGLLKYWMTGKSPEAHFPNMN